MTNLEQAARAIPHSHLKSLLTSFQVWRQKRNSMNGNGKTICRREPGPLKIAQARQISLLTNMFETSTKECSTKRGSGPGNTVALRRTSEFQSTKFERDSWRCVAAYAIGSRTTPILRMR